ncbi:MAG: helix-turn-helix domain-containing protein, partial [Polaromonas sp.]
TVTSAEFIKARKAIGISRLSLARVLGLTYQAVRKIEIGESTPSSGTAQAVRLLFWLFHCHPHTAQKWIKRNVDHFKKNH